MSQFNLFDTGAGTMPVPVEVEPQETRLIGDMPEVRKTCAGCGLPMISFTEHQRRLCGNCKVNKKINSITKG